MRDKQQQGQGYCGHAAMDWWHRRTITMLLMLHLLSCISVAQLATANTTSSTDELDLSPSINPSLFTNLSLSNTTSSTDLLLSTDQSLSAKRSLSSTATPSTNCMNLKVFNGDHEVTDSVCQKEYLTRDCLEFSKDFNSADLPDDSFQGDSVQRPGSFSVLPRSYPFSDGPGVTNHFPGLDFKWSSPTSGTAMRSLNGFFIWIQSDDSAQTECRIFNVSRSNFHAQKLNFQYQIPQISPVMARNYTVRIYTLPFPQHDLLDWINNRENYKGKLVTTRKPYQTKNSTILPSDQWTSGISTETNLESRSIEVTFTLPNKNLNYGFTHYRIFLINVNKNFYDAEQTKNKQIDVNLNETESSVVFEGLSTSAWYRVKVQIIDPFRDDDDRCLCYHMVSKYNGRVFKKDCANVCGISSSGIFNLQGKVLPPEEAIDLIREPHSTMPSTTLSTMPSTSPSTTNKDDDENNDDNNDNGGNTGDNSGDNSSGQSNTTKPNGPVPGEVKQEADTTSSSDLSLTLIIVGVVIALILIGIGAAAVWLKQSRRKKDFFPLEPPPVPNPAPLPSLSNKSIYLIASTDHPEHQKWLQVFVEFLKTMCYCDVTQASDLNTTKEHAGIQGWLSNQLTSCDYIVFVDSTGARRRLQEYVDSNHVKYQPKDSLMAEDLFNMCMEQVCTKSIPINKVLLVYNTTQPGLITKSLLLNKSYRMTRGIIHFLSQIHKLDRVPNAAQIYGSLLPLKRDNHHNLPILKKLQASFDEVEKFEKETPDWFSTYFEPIACPPEKQMVKRNESKTSDSDYGSMPRSVTPSPDSSPVDMPDHLDFTQYPDDQSQSIFTIETQSASSQNTPEGRGIILKRSEELLEDDYSQALVNINNESKHKMLLLSANTLIPPRTLKSLNIEHEDVKSSIVHINNCDQLLFSRPINPVVDNREDLLSIILANNNSSNNFLPIEVKKRDHQIKAPINPEFDDREESTSIIFNHNNNDNKQFFIPVAPNENNNNYTAKSSFKPAFSDVEDLKYDGITNQNNSDKHSIFPIPEKEKVHVEVFDSKIGVDDVSIEMPTQEVESELDDGFTDLQSPNSDINGNASGLLDPDSVMAHNEVTMSLSANSKSSMDSAYATDIEMEVIC